MHAFEDQLFRKLCWHVRRISINKGYSSASFKLVVVSAVMSQQLTLFGKVAAGRKVYGKLTNNCEQFVDALVADECRCSPSLPLQQAEKFSWRMLHEKRLIMARLRWLYQMFCLPLWMMVSVWQNGSLFQFWNSRLIRNSRLMCWH